MMDRLFAQIHSSYNEYIMMDCLSQAFSLIVVIEESHQQFQQQQQQPCMVTKQKKFHKALKPCVTDRKLRCLRKKWLKIEKTNKEIKQLVKEYYHEKHPKKQKYLFISSYS